MSDLPSELITDSELAKLFRGAIGREPSVIEIGRLRAALNRLWKKKRLRYWLHQNQHIKQGDEANEPIREILKELQIGPVANIWQSFLINTAFFIFRPPVLTVTAPPPPRPIRERGKETQVVSEWTAPRLARQVDAPLSMKIRALRKAIYKQLNKENVITKSDVNIAVAGTALIAIKDLGQADLHFLSKKFEGGGAAVRENLFNQMNREGKRILSEKVNSPPRPNFQKPDDTEDKFENEISRMPMR